MLAKRYKEQYKPGTRILLLHMGSDPRPVPDNSKGTVIVSVFKLIQDLLGPGAQGKNQFQILMSNLPEEHKARWFAGAALNTSEQAMASVMSTALSRLNAFLDSELEQILCFDTAIDAEQFCSNKSAIFVVLPEEDTSKHFMVSLIVQQMYREILAVADEHGGTLPNRVMMYLDEFGTSATCSQLKRLRTRQ